MAKAIQMHQPGGPDVLRYEDVEVGDPASGQVRISQQAVGLNYIDVYHRSGLYPLPLPSILGMEGAGVVEAVGPDVSDFRVGDLVCYAGAIGGYASERLIAADRLVKRPDSIDAQQAAAMMLQGLTVQYLIRRTCQVQAGDTVLLHAAAGGVGLIACQWLKHIGATVIGTVGSDAKAELAEAHGCHHTINYQQEDFAARVREITNGAGVRVVYDSIGRDTFYASLDCLQPLGMMVTFGNASGPVEPLDPGILGKKGSLFLTRPTIMTYIAKRADLLAMAAELFAVVESGAVRIEVKQSYALADTAQAHTDLEARKTTGSTILIP